VGASSISAGEACGRDRGRNGDQRDGPQQRKDDRALRRARAALTDIDRDSAPSQPSPDERELLAAYIDAFERHDVDALVSLLRDDAIVEMPPFDLWLQGKQDIRQWLIAVDALADHLLTPIAANGSPAVAVYRPETPGSAPAAFAIHVLDVVAGCISAIHSFIDPALFELFGLPPTGP
jgi:RNA polymerase sigma-70 factor, ECF subfamily